MGEKESGEKIEPAKMAAVASVIAHITSGRKSSGAAGAAAATGREAWKMAGRAERLGIGPSDKPFTGRV